MAYHRKKFAAIYEIYNILEEKYYVGRSVDVFNRWQQHLEQLFYKKHHNKELQEAFDKDGYRAFQFKILKISSKKKLPALEKELIEQYNRRDLPLYNISGNKKKAVLNKE